MHMFKRPKTAKLLIEDWAWAHSMIVYPVVHTDTVYTTGTDLPKDLQ